jgi:hypothetical protein
MLKAWPSVAAAEQGVILGSEAWCIADDPAVGRGQCHDTLQRRAPAGADEAEERGSGRAEEQGEGDEVLLRELSLLNLLALHPSIGCGILGAVPRLPADSREASLHRATGFSLRPPRVSSIQW